MTPRDVLLNHLQHLELNRLGQERPAGLWICSLPLPPRASTDLSLAGRPGFRQPVGAWPDTRRQSPRRLLMATPATGEAPDTIRVQPGAPASDQQPPQAEARLFARSTEKFFVWERHVLRISWGGRAVELAMGLRTNGEVHWWEACRLVVRRETDACRVVEMGGAIPLELMNFEEMRKEPGYKNRFLHYHNWLNGHIYARLHANGVCEIFAHHVNSKFFDEGRQLDDCVPVIGIRAEPDADDASALCGRWDGSRTELALGEVKLDVTEGARLASPERPGRVDLGEDFLVWQPYMGVELYGGICPKEVTGDGYIFKAEERIFPRGFARTVRFSLSLDPATPPTVVRYLPPAWWYGACEELRPGHYLPISNEFGRPAAEASQWLKERMIRGGFEDGCVPRNHGLKEETRDEPGWEGEIPYAQFLAAWRSGDAEEYDAAMRSAWFFTDVCIDHAAKLVRMHGYPPSAFSLPMNRVLGSIAAWLETGDTYLIDAAEAVTENAYRLHKNSWPRLAVGRDACFVRGAVMLYRYTGHEHWLERARDTISDVFQSQRPEGSFGDQGGGTGIHQWGAYITKPWMGLMAVGGAIDYLELRPYDKEVLDGVRRFADWLMNERHEHEGVMGWSYQHDFDGGRQFYNFKTDEVVDLPTRSLWHTDYLARLLTFCSLRFGDPAYFEAWRESYEGMCRRRRSAAGDHFCAQAIQFLPWLQSSLCPVTVTDEGLTACPVWLGDATPRHFLVATPQGTAEIQWSEIGQCSCAEGAPVKLDPKFMVRARADS